MRRKVNCPDNGCHEKLFALLKRKLIYLQNFESVEYFQRKLIEYRHCNNRRMKAKLKGLPSAIHRQQTFRLSKEFVPLHCYRTSVYLFFGYRQNCLQSQPPAENGYTRGRKYWQADEITADAVFSEENARARRRRICRRTAPKMENPATGRNSHKENLHCVLGKDEL